MGNVLQLLDRALSRSLGLLNIIASIWIVGIMLLISADVIGRLFSSPLFGVPEIVKVSVVGIVWLQMAYTLRVDQHLRSNLIFAALSDRWKSIVYVLNCLAGLAVFGLIVAYTYDDVYKAFERGTFEGEHPMRIAVWPIWAILVLGSGLTALEFAVQAFKTVVLGYDAAIADDKGGSGAATLVE